MYQMFPPILSSVLLILALSSWSAPADELIDLKETLVAVNKETDEIQNEIKGLELASKERAARIQSLRAKIKTAKAQMDSAQDRLTKIRQQSAELEKNETELNQQATAAENQLAAVTKELEKINAEYAKATAQHKAKMAKIEANKREELKRKADLTKRVANFESHLQKQSGQREAAEREVDKIYQGNEKLYDRLKGH
jgi:chromosome segregation ATPase